MYPVIGRIGRLEITSFGVMVALGFLAGLWVFRRQLRARGLPEHFENAAIIGAAGGLLGAKVIWVVEFSGTAPVADLLFSRGGLSWFGLGCVGCFLVGDDYGQPSSLPWAVAFPNGLPPTDVPVHPTRIYEALVLGWLAWLLIREQRRGVSDRHILGHYLILAGGFRFILEFIRINEPVPFGITVAQIFASILAATGAVLLTRALRVAVVAFFAAADMASYAARNPLGRHTKVLPAGKIDRSVRGLRSGCCSGFQCRARPAVRSGHNAIRYDQGVKVLFWRTQ